MSDAAPQFWDVEWFVERLTFIDKTGKRRQLGESLYPEQRRFLKVFRDSNKDILVLKPRQMGMTTIVIACLFWRIYTCPDPIGALSIMHEDRACKRINKMLREFIQGLPAPLRPTLNKDNAHELEFEHNGAGLMHLMAGSRGEGRSFTYQMLHCSEMGQWPQGSAATKGSGDGADEDTWASVNATLHDGPYTRIVCEFTGDGVGGVGHGMVLTARESDAWEFLFFAWFEFEFYETDVPQDWARNEHDFKEETEAAIIRNHYQELGESITERGIDRKLAWRRAKLTDKKYTMRRFKREYPSSWDDPFKMAENAWFDQDVLAELLEVLAWRFKREAHEDDLRVYIEYDHRYVHFVGMDTSGGTGKDDAVIVVMREDYEVCAVWSSNLTATDEQADIGAQLSARYGEATVLCEQNKYGKDVIERMEGLGVPTWKDERYKNFYMQAGRAGETKREAYSYAREKIRKQHAVQLNGENPLINDETILEQLAVIREGDDGRLEAPPGKHDDHADAWVLALFCSRDYAPEPPPTQDDVTMRLIKKLRRR